MQTVLKRIAMALLILLVLIYTGDSVAVLLRARHPTSTDPYETITAYRIIAIGEKGDKTEYDVDQVNPTQTGECVHALFPHKGDPPCWYLRHKFAQPIPMTILPSLRRQRTFTVLPDCVGALQRGAPRARQT